MHSIWRFIGDNASEIIALSAFFLATYQFYLSRKSSKLSVIPHIAHYISTAKSDGVAIFEFVISNTGLGPAKICEWKFLLEDKNISDSKFQNIENYLNHIFSGKKPWFTSGKLGVGHLMSSGEKFRILRVRLEIENLNDLKEIEENLNKLDLIIEYESIYGDYFILSTKD